MKKSIYALALLALLLPSCGQRAKQDAANALPGGADAPGKYAATRESFPGFLPKGFYSLRQYADSLIRYEQLISAATPGSGERNRSERVFFELFPSNFDSFKFLYGNITSILEPQSHGHLVTLFTLHSIDEQIMVGKLIGLAFHGTWKAGGVNQFQVSLLNHFSRYLPKYLEQLSTYSVNEILSFWYFLYDGPHPDHPIVNLVFQDLYDRTKALNPRMAALKRKSYFKGCSLPNGFYSLRQYADTLISFERLISAATPGTRERNRSEREFFELFPSNFECFKYLYGNITSPLELQSLDHVETLFSLHSIDEQEFVAKLIGLALHGTWKADGVGYLRHSLKKHVLNILPQYVEQLSAHTENEIISFWYFLFDGPHPDDPDVKRTFQELYSQCKALKPRVADLLRQAYDKLLSEKRCLGH